MLVAVGLGPERRRGRSQQATSDHSQDLPYPRLTWVLKETEKRLDSLACYSFPVSQARTGSPDLKTSCHECAVRQLCHISLGNNPTSTQAITAHFTDRCSRLKQFA